MCLNLELLVGFILSSDYTVSTYIVGDVNFKTRKLKSISFFYHTFSFTFIDRFMFGAKCHILKVVFVFWLFFRNQVHIHIQMVYSAQKWWLIYNDILLDVKGYCSLDGNFCKKSKSRKVNVKKKWKRKVFFILSVQLIANCGNSFVTKCIFIIEANFYCWILENHFKSYKNSGAAFKQILFKCSFFKYAMCRRDVRSIKRNSCDRCHHHHYTFLKITSCLTSWNDLLFFYSDVNDLQ